MSIFTVNNTPPIIEDEKFLFYSQDWERTRVFTLSILPHFDILITNKFLYLIAFSTNVAHSVAGTMGVLGPMVADSAEKKERNKVRSTWLDSNLKLISREYEKGVLLKIPSEKLKESLLLKKFFRQHLAIFTFDNQKITLQNNTDEYERFAKYVG